jgi:aspartyl/asparaginyl beta-hydroxylase (cupin superfamily)
MLPAPDAFAAMSSTPDISAIAEQAEQLARGGRPDMAARLFEQVLARDPAHARALSWFAMQAYGRGELDRALELIGQASRGEPKLALVEANRALVLQARGDLEGALGALLSALERDPDFVPARLDAGLLLDRMGRGREAVEHLRMAVGRLPPPAAQPPELRARSEAAQRILAREQQAFEQFVEQRLAQHGAGGDGLPARFAECLDIFLQRRRPQLPKPGAMFFPELPPIAFFPPALFDWVQRVQAATDEIRAELEGVLAAEQEFIPYVQKGEDASAPGSVWARLNHRRDWGAYFLFNQGERVGRHCEACPRTAALLESLPLVRIPGRGPTAFFSRLKPGTHIPAHHGATNTRSIVHLPLVVPPDCGLRVGNHVHAWQPGKVVVFDDTIEHEAWNRSDRERVVLIFDVWNPFLDARERALVAELTAAAAEYHPGRLHDTD